jgi:hypothetical protein
VNRHNAVRLQLHALAYNLANFLRTPALPADVEHWSLTTLREKLVKTGARIVRHGRYVVFQLAEVAVPRALFAAIMRRIDRLRPEPLGVIEVLVAGEPAEPEQSPSWWRTFLPRRPSSNLVIAISVSPSASSSSR